MLAAVLLLAAASEGSERREPHVTQRVLGNVATDFRTRDIVWGPNGEYIAYVSRTANGQNVLIRNEEVLLTTSDWITLVQHCRELTYILERRVAALGGTVYEIHRENVPLASGVLDAGCLSDTGRLWFVKSTQDGFRYVLDGVFDVAAKSRATVVAHDRAGLLVFDRELGLRGATQTISLVSKTKISDWKIEDENLIELSASADFSTIAWVARDEQRDRIYKNGELFAQSALHVSPDSGCERPATERSRLEQLRVSATGKHVAWLESGGCRGRTRVMLDRAEAKTIQVENSRLISVLDSGHLVMTEARRTDRFYRVDEFLALGQFEERIGGSEALPSGLYYNSLELSDGRLRTRPWRSPNWQRDREWSIASEHFLVKARNHSIWFAIAGNRFVLSPVDDKCTDVIVWNDDLTRSACAGVASAARASIRVGTWVSQTFGEILEFWWRGKTRLQVLVRDERLITQLTIDFENP